VAKVRGVDVANQSNRLAYQSRRLTCQSKGLELSYTIYIVASNTKIGISGEVVLRLTEDLLSGYNYKVFVDNWFTSYSLVLELKCRGLLAVGTVRPNRISGCTFKTDELLKREKGWPRCV